MKKFFGILFAATLLFSNLPAHVVYAEITEYHDNAFDKAGDWFATLGKQGTEKDRILAERKAERVRKHIEKNANAAAKDMEKAGDKMKKDLGF